MTMGWGAQLPPPPGSQPPDWALDPARQAAAANAGEQVSAPWSAEQIAAAHAAANATADEQARQRADVIARWNAIRGEVVGRVRALPMPRRVVVAALHWTQDIADGEATARDAQRHRGVRLTGPFVPGPLVAAMWADTFPEWWPNASQVRLDTTSPPWDSAATAVWFANEARARRLEIPRKRASVKGFFGPKLVDAWQFSGTGSVSTLANSDWPMWSPTRVAVAANGSFIWPQASVFGIRGLVDIGYMIERKDPALVPPREVWDRADGRA